MTPTHHICLKWMAIGPQCISITGPTQSGKTTVLQEICTTRFSCDRSDLRTNTKDLFWIDALTEIPNQSFFDFYHKKLRLFCTTTSKSGKVRMLVVDDVDLYPSVLQTQLYALIQRHRAELHIVVSYTCPTQVIPALHKQFISLPLSVRALPPSDITTAIQSSLGYIKKTAFTRSTKMANEWISLYHNGLLISDIVAFIGECIRTSPLFSDAHIFDLYTCYKKCPIKKDHCFFLYLLANALCNMPVPPSTIG